jgi:hypothetical protein
MTDEPSTMSMEHEAARHAGVVDRRGVSFWLRPTWWVRALAFWWLPALLGLFIGIVGAARLARGGVAMSWRGMDKR